MIRLEDVSHAIGSEVYDEYGRVIGVLVSFSSTVEGEIEYVEVKITDTGIKRIEGERIKIDEGKLVAVPEWKHKAVKIINALDRAYRRRKALDTMSSSELPSEVVDTLKRKLDEQIKKLKLEAEKSSREIKERIQEIGDESLHVESAIALLQMTYFSGEIGERQYTTGMNNLRKLRNTLSAEKADAKKVLDKLEKTIETATSIKESKPVKAPSQPHPVASHPVKTPVKHTPDTMVVKIED